MSSEQKEIAWRRTPNTRLKIHMPNKKDKPTNTKLDADAFERELTTDLDAETADKPKGMPLHTRILIGLAVGVIAGVTVNWIWGGDHPRVAWVVDHFTN